MPQYEGGSTTEVVVGTITGDQGNPNSLTNGWPVKVTDGTSVLGTPAHPLSVDGSSVTQPVSATTLPLPAGAATDATLSTLTKPSDQQHVIVDSSAPVPVTGTFFQATQPISATALPLPAGAAIASKQPAIGSAGTASTDVITVQGIAGATPLPVTLTGGSIEIGTVDQGTGGTSAWKVDGSAVTQPISGTVSVSGTIPISAVALPLPSGAATESTLATLTKPSDQQHVIVDSSASIPVTGVFFQTTQPVSGTVSVSGTTAVSAASLPLPSGASTAAKQPSLGTAGTAATDVITVQGIAGATPIPVSLSTASIEIGTVDQGTGGSSAWKVDGSAVTQPVSIASAVAVTGTFFQATQPVSAVSLPLPSGAATEATLATRTKPSDQQHVIIDSSTSIAVTGPVTDANLDEKFGDLGQAAMAASAPVVIASDQSSIPVTGAFFQATQPVSAASLPLPTGAAVSAKQPSLGTAGSASADVITVQGVASMTALKVDGSAVTQPVTGTFFQATQPVSASSLPLPTGAATEATLLTRTKPSDQQHVIVDSSATVAVTGAFFQATQPVSATTLPLPSGASTAAKQPSLGAAGTASTDVITVQGIAGATPIPVSLSTASIEIGTVDQGTGGTSAWKVDGSAVTQPVSGTFFPATQPVSAVALPLPSGAATEATLLTRTKPADQQHVIIDSSASIAVTGSFFQATQPVSAASLPLPSGAATAAKQPAIGTAGTASADVLTVQGKASMTPLLVDGSGVTQPISGTVSASQSGTWTVQPGNTANTTAWKVDGSAVTQPVSGTVSVSGTVPVSGTVTANIGTSGSLALDATLTGGTQKSKLVDSGGTNVATVSAGGALKVDGSAVTQPVSGAFFQATQPISGTVAVSGTTAVSAVSLPLPSGASTAAKQPAIGTAGSASADVLTVQGAASMTALKVDGSAVTQPVSGPLTDAQLRATPVTVSGTVTAANSSVSATGAAPPASATYAGASVTTAAPSYTTGQMSALSLSTAGNLRVDGSSVTQPVSAVSLPLPTGASTSAKQPALGVAGTASTDVLTVQGAAAMTALKVDGSAVTQPVSGTVTANIGTTNGLALDATLTGGTQKTKLVDSGGTNLATISAGGALKVDGSAVTQPVSGTFFQTTQPVSAAALPLPTGAATEATLATRTKPSDQQHVIIDSSASIPVTGTFFQATQPISGAVTTTASDYVPATGTITALDTGTSNLTGANGQVFYFGTPTTNSAVVFSAAGLSSITLSSGGLGSGTLVVEVTLDGGSFWIRSNVYQIGTQSYANGFVAPFVATVNVLGMTNVRVRSITSWSGTATITARGSSTTRNVTIGDALPSGANTIGAVTQASGPWTQNLTKVGGSNILIGQTAMAASLPVALASDQSAIPVTGTFFQATQPISITDIQGTGTISALNSAVTANTAGASTVTFYITGTWVATLSFEGSVDGTNWFSVNGDVDTTDTIQSSTTINTFVTIGCGGFSGVRIRASAYTSGTATVAYNSGLGVNFVEVFSTNPASLLATVVGQGAAGTPAGGILTVQGVSGGTPLAIRAGDIASFMACTSAAVSTTATAATTTSIAYLFHSAASTKTIKIRKILVTGSVSGTPAVQASVQGAFITAQNATPGGTLQTVNGLNRANTTDATNVFRTGATGAPTRVTGDLLSGSLGTSNGQFIWEADISGQPIVLRAGTAEGFEIRTVVNTVALGAAALAANVAYYWTEE